MANINNLVIDRVLRGNMTSHTDGSILWSLTQITNPSLNISSDSVDAVDAIGTPIMTFNRAKTAEFSAENSLFDLALSAAQAGTDLRTASSTSKITVPMFEEIDVTGDSITLKHTPTKQITNIYLLNGDSTLATKFKNGATASATDFVHAADSNTIKVPTGLPAGSQIFVQYEYEAASAVEVINTAKDFPKAGKFVMEVLGADVCDSTNLIHFYIVFPNAKLLADVDLTFTTEGTHPFSIKANVDYCDKEKRLFYIVVPDEE